MTPRQMQIAFERELNIIDDLQKPTSDTTLYWLNQAVMKFVKTRYSGVNSKTESFEQSQKRMEDLRTLVSLMKGTAQATGILSNEYSVLLGDDHLIHLSTSVGILPKNQIAGDNCWKKNAAGEYIKRYSDPIQVTQDTLDRQLENSLSEHNLHYCAAKPLQLIRGRMMYFYTDDNYQVTDCNITYLKTPTAITLDSPFLEYTDLPKHTHSEIVKLAVQMYLENTMNQRYTSYSNEVNTME